MRLGEDAMINQRFGFQFASTYRLAALPFGVTPSTCQVCCGTDSFDARFGPWRVRTTPDNIANVSITGPYTFVKTAGPAHLSLSDRGLTFATNGDRGVCIQFLVPVAGIEPTGRLRHPSLTVTVADCDGLVNTLRRTA
jgi:hypothetical protein